MRDRPSGPELLWQARQVLLQELLPRLPEEKKYDVLMIGAAMATAAREAEAGDAPLKSALDRLQSVLGETPGQVSEPSALAEELLRLMSRAAQEIRSGRRDAEGQMHTVLTEIAADKLRESSPKHLEARRRR